VKTILEQVVAANFDYVFIMSSLNGDFNVNRFVRYLTQARQSGGQPVILLSKADLLGVAGCLRKPLIQPTNAFLADDFTELVADVRRAAANVPIHVISAHTGYGLETLGDYLRPGKTAVFLGMSGVGKSSLLNTLMEREVMEVKTIREDDSRGRHTTTHRQLFMLPSGAMVIDTPGMRELGFFDADDGIGAEYADVEALISQCRFSDCLHKSEPGCAIHMALTNGSLAQDRWERYTAQKREKKFTDDRTGYLTGKQARNKSAVMRNKQSKMEGRIQK
jgi:ribosome biogenesis GTPase